MTRVAVVHNLRPGGAARRLYGTVRELIGDAEFELREFTLSTGSRTLATMAGGTSSIPQTSVDYLPFAPRARRATRPPLRYIDDILLRARWRALAGEVSLWRPDVVFGNPCGVLLAAPPIHSYLDMPMVYYCDEPRRHDYEPAAHNATNPSTRAMYAPLRIREKRSDRAEITAANSVITNSDHSRRAIAAAYGRQSTVISPGVAPAFNRLAKDFDNFGTHFLSVGSLIPSKGHDLAIRAVGSSCVDLPLQVVAPRSDADEQRRLSAIANEEGVKVTFNFAVDDVALAGLYGGALATLYLARAEPLGLVSLESQACGTPCVVADEGGLPSTVDDGQTGFVVKRTAQDAGRALDRLASPDVRRRVFERIAAKPTRRDGDAAAEVAAVLSSVGKAG